MGLGTNLIIVAMLLWVVVMVVFGSLTRDVARVAPPKTNRPFRNLMEANNLGRVWREHKRHFPNSLRRKALVVLTALTIFFVYLGFHLAK